MNAYVSDSRTVSGFELLLGAAIVIGHNVFKVLPNEVPILFVLGLASVKLRNGGFAAMGFRGPASWKRTVAIALAAAALRIVLSAVVIDPLTAHFWPPATAPEGSGDISGNPVEALKWLVLVWTFAAFGEEISYRGYLMTRTADLGRQSTAAWLAALVVSARPLLQGAVRNSGLRCRRADPRRRVPLIGAGAVDEHPGTRIHRYVWRDGLVFRLGFLISGARSRPTTR